VGLPPRGALPDDTCKVLSVEREEAEAHQRAELVSAANVVLACPGGDEVVTVAKSSSVPVIFLEKMPVAKGPGNRSPGPSRS
jgi:hypothetical protein